MKVFAFIAPLLLLCNFAAVVMADEKANDNKNLLRAYIEKFGQPGPENKLLDQLVGNWHANVKMWMDPGQAPQTSEGTLHRKSIFDGRFVQENFEGKAMGHAFLGNGTLGYDRAKKQFVCSWIDSMSTAINQSYGTYDDATRTWTFRHEDTCPITGKPVKTRTTLRVVSADQEQMEAFYQLGDEKEMQTLEITFSRQR